MIVNLIYMSKDMLWISGVDIMSVSSLIEISGVDTISVSSLIDISGVVISEIS